MSLSIAVVLPAAAAGPAFALSCERPNEPFIPSGGSTSARSMESAEAGVQDYVAAMQDYIDCLIREAEDARDESAIVVGRWNDAVREFNSR